MLWDMRVQLSTESALASYHGLHRMLDPDVHRLRSIAKLGKHAHAHAHLHGWSCEEVAHVGNISLRFTHSGELQ